jgi:NADPH:quinone reductase-like Zn-dependent oxidoreductase
VIDFAGASRWDKNIAALAPDGRMVMLSFLSGRELEKVDLGLLLFKRFRIQGTTLCANGRRGTQIAASRSNQAAW